MPIRTFWSFSRNIDRIYAEQDLRMATMLIRRNSPEDMSAYIEELSRRMGRAVEFDEQALAREKAMNVKRDTAGLMALKGA